MGGSEDTSATFGFKCDDLAPVWFNSFINILTKFRNWFGLNDFIINPQSFQMDVNL